MTGSSIEAAADDKALRAPTTIVVTERIGAEPTAAYCRHLSWSIDWMPVHASRQALPAHFSHDAARDGCCPGELALSQREDGVPVRVADPVRVGAALMGEQQVPVLDRVAAEGGDAAVDDGRVLQKRAVQTPLAFEGSEIGTQIDEGEAPMWVKHALAERNRAERLEAETVRLGHRGRGQPIGALSFGVEVSI